MSRERCICGWWGSPGGFLNLNVEGDWPPRYE